LKPAGATTTIVPLSSPATLQPRSETRQEGGEALKSILFVGPMSECRETSFYNHRAHTCAFRSCPRATGARSGVQAALPFPTKERVWERLAVWHLGASLGAFRIIALAKLSEFNTARQLLLGIALHSNTLLFVEQAERL
jgi:hypothetical protein